MKNLDMEQRLQAFAAESTRVPLPIALLDRLDEIDAGGVPAERRLRPLRTRWDARRRNLSLLGVAAVLALGGSVAAAGAGVIHLGPSTPTFVPMNHGEIGPWTKSGAIALDPERYQYTTLSWEDGEIVGTAYGIDGNDAEHACVVSSTNGADWTCAPLPVPADLDCMAPHCLEMAGVARRDGLWVAVADGPVALTWTSRDGSTWQEQRSARFATGAEALDTYFAHDALVVGSAGIAWIGAGTDEAIYTTVDGTSWTRATVGGTGRFLAVAAAGDLDGGFVAAGSCLDTKPVSIGACAAFSPDGLRWSANLVQDGTGKVVDRALSLEQNPIAYVAGRWALALRPDDGSVNEMYLATSSDGTRWAIVRDDNFTWLQVGARRTQGGPGGIWAVNGEMWVTFGNAPVATDSALSQTPRTTVWSEDGATWIGAGDQLPVLPYAIVDTPTRLIGIAPSVDGPTYEVWTADKKYEPVPKRTKRRPSAAVSRFAVGASLALPTPRRSRSPREGRSSGS